MEGRKIELLTVKEIATETGLKELTIRNSINRGDLKAQKISGVYRVKRRDLNTFLGIPNNDELIKKDLEIKDLQNTIEGYKRQNRQIKQLLQVLNGAIESL